MKKVMEYIDGSVKNGQGVFINLIAATGKESFYRQFGFTERPNEASGAGMAQWIFKIGPIT